MLDEYKRNGELFLRSIKEGDENEEKSIDDLIKENFRKPVLELVGNTAIGENVSEKDILNALGRHFEVSGKSREILNASFFKTRKGKCSLCGKTTDVFSNRSYIFPFERKIDSILPENSRLQFCKECGFTLYCGMAFLYGKGDKRGNGNLIKFFFDSYNSENLYTINYYFKHSNLRDPNNYNKIKKFKFFVCHPYETLFAIIFEFVNRLKENNLINKIKDIDDVNLLLVVGSGQLQETYTIKGSELHKFVSFFSAMIDESKETYKKIKKDLRVDSERLIFEGFFNRLTIGQNFEEKSRLRNLFVKNLLGGKIDFITLNEIIMERVKTKEKMPFPLYYYNFLNLYMNIFKMEKEQQMFKRVNGLGWSIGEKIRNTNLEDVFVWEIFRARGVEEFYNVLVELQTKLKMYMDLEPVNEYEKEWRKVKAILLNGILNALYR